MPIGALALDNGFPAPAPPGARGEPLPLPGANSEPDPVTDQAIRQAQAEVMAGSGSPTEAARARAAVDAARTLAARGQAFAARFMAEEAARGLGDESEAAPPPLPGSGTAPASIFEEEPELTYQDASGDPQASFQYATGMTAGQAAIMVPHHEQGHVIHAFSRAMASGREVVQAYTRVHYRMDWRTGRLVAAGGQAVVKTRAKPAAPAPDWLA